MDANFDINKIAVDLIDKNSEKVFKKFGAIIKNNYKKFKIDFGFAFKEYLENSYKKYSKIKTILYRTEPIFIYDIFECNILSMHNKEVSAEDVNEILKISNFLIIKGTGGIGKSTLLKHFFLNELEKNDLIPIFIELKDLDNEDDTLYKCIYSSLEKLGFKLEKEYFEYALNTGCFLFLLDGYDEIPSIRVKGFLKEFDCFCDKYSNNYFIMSTRPNDEFVSFQRFTVLSALPFTKDQSISLISKINIEYLADAKERFLQQLKENLYDKHKSFASNPLLLNMMLLTFDNYAEIPEKLHIFYANAFETMYFKHDATKGAYKREILSNLTYDNFKNTFAKFCFLTYYNRKIEFTLNELIEYLKKSSCVDNLNERAYIEDLKCALCVLYNEGLNYKFVHRSFQEYFTAVYLKELSDEQQELFSNYLIRNDSKRRYYNDQVFAMLFDMAQSRFEKNIILPILKGTERKFNNKNLYEGYSELIICPFEVVERESNDKIRAVRYMRQGGNFKDFILGICNKYYNNSNIDYFDDVINFWDSFATKIKVSERNYIYTNGKKKEHYEFDFIIKNEQYLEFLNDSSIGQLITVLSTLQKKLSDKQINSALDLENLLNFKK